MAATGILGFVFFIWWLVRLLQCNAKLETQLRQQSFINESIILDGLRMSLLAEFLILILSQNILRPYLWILIGMLNAFYFQFKPLVFAKVKLSNHNPEIHLDLAKSS